MAAASEELRRRVRAGRELLRSRGRTALARALRLTGAAVAAYVVADALSASPRPVLAPLTALLVVQVTLFSTVTNGLRRVVSVVVGVGLAVGVSAVVGFSWWSLGAVVAVSIVAGQLLRLGPHLLEVPISAMLVLAVGSGAESLATDRLAETLVGAGVGLAFNVVVPPPLAHRGAAAAVEALADEIADLVGAVATDVGAGVTLERAVERLQDARRVTRHVARVEQAVLHAEESRRLNPRAVGTLDAGPGLRSGFDALERCSVSLRSVCRSIVDRLRVRPDTGDEHEVEVREAFAALLNDLAAALRAYGRLVVTEIRSPDGDRAAPDEELLAAREAVGEARVRAAELLLVDAARDPELWELHAVLLASVERMLAELDVEERIRLRQRRRDDAAARPRPAQAVGRLRASTRDAVERPAGLFPRPGRAARPGRMGTESGAPGAAPEPSEHPRDGHRQP